MKHTLNTLILNRLQNGACGDHIAIQGMSNVFNIAINVLSSENPSMIRVVPIYECLS